VASSFPAVRALCNINHASIKIEAVVLLGRLYHLPSSPANPARKLDVRLRETTEEGAVDLPCMAGAAACAAS
jgi:hypothetical protein